MDHKKAEQNSAVEKYLLNEFTTGERLEFEAHFFDCPICADLVRQGAISIDNIKGVFRENPVRGTVIEKTSRPGSRWFSWVGAPALVPSLAALVLAAVVGYQNLVSIPRLERPLVLSSDVLTSVSRGIAPVIKVDRKQALFNLNFEIDSPQAYPSYQCEFRNQANNIVLSVNSGEKKVASFTLDLLLPTDRFPPGAYAMVLRPDSSPNLELRRYDFVIQDQGENH
jgi:hypothetical protein